VKKAASAAFFVRGQTRAMDDFRPMAGGVAVER